VATLTRAIRRPVTVRHLPIVLLAGILVAAAVVIMHAGRDTTFFYDDWNFVTMRIGWRPHILLYPHNEHLSLLPVLVYKLVFETVGLEHYGVLRAISAAFNITCATLLFIYARRRLGDWIALGLASCLVVMGVGAWDIVWPFQIGFLGSLAATLGALLMLDRGTRPGDIAACVLVAITLSSSSLGVMLLAGVVVEVLLRPNRLRRLWIPAIPAVLYGLWYLKYGVGHLDWANGVPKIPSHIAQGTRGGIAAATGQPYANTWLLAWALVGALVFTLARGRDRLPRVLMVATMPLLFWTLEALARTGLSSIEPRYMYPNGVFIALVAAEAFLLIVPRATAGALAIAIVLWAGAIGNASSLNGLGDQLRGFALSSRSSLTAAELLRDTLGPNTLPDPSQPQLFLGRYESAVKAYGSTITWSLAEIPRRSAAERAAVDAALIRLIGPFAGRATAAPPPNCAQFPGDGTDRRARLKSGQLYVKAGGAPVEVRLRRFGDLFTDSPQVTVKPQSQATVGLPKDRSPTPWIAAVRSSSRFSACQL